MKDLVTKVYLNCHLSCESDKVLLQFTRLKLSQNKQRQSVITPQKLTEDKEEDEEGKIRYSRRRR